MGARRIKVAKKPVDKLEIPLTATERARTWVEENYTRVAAGAGILLLVLVGFWGFDAYGEAKEKRAQADYAQLMVKWPEKESVEAAVWEGLTADLEKYVKENQGTNAALNAELDLANAFMQTGKYNDALKWAKKVLDANPPAHDLRTLARYELALICEALGKTDEALTHWNALKAEGGKWLGREVEWHLARLYWKKAEYAKAVEAYDLAMKAPGNYPSTALLQEEHASVKGKTESPKRNETTDAKSGGG